MKGGDALLPALVASDADPLVPVFVGHRGQGNVHVGLFNDEPLVFGADHHLLTERTAPLARFEKGGEAVGMESVAAGQELDRFTGRVEGVEANRTVVAGGIQGTSVRLEGRRFHANPALIAVRVVLGAADTTNAALVAVELTLFFIVQEDTDRAPVGAKDSTVAAAVDTIDTIASITDRVGFLN